jgi:hypothetical protein
MDAPAISEPIPQPSLMRIPNHTAEWLALLQCAAPRPHLDRFASQVQGPMNWSSLLLGAQKHGLVPLLAAHIGNLDDALPPSEFREALRKLQRVQILFSLQLTAELFRVLKNLSKNDIKALVTKGPALSVRCYADPGLRQYGDLDLILRDSDIRRTTQIMIELGYEPRIPMSAIDAQKIPGEYAFRKPDTSLLVEFHTERTLRYHPRPLNINELFNRRATVTIDSHSVPVPSLEDELVLICIHGAKHFWERLMWIADVAALISAEQPANWDRATAMAKEVGAERMLFLGLRLAADILGAELPAQVQAKIDSDRTAAKLAAQIERRLVLQETEIGLLQRAVFRVRMRGNLMAGTSYLLRLSLSSTEEDWTPAKAGNRPAFVEAITRPLRLAKKHSRRSDM